MEQIKIVWIIVFFLFALTLLLAWSKIIIIQKKAKAIDAILSQLNDLEKKEAVEKR